MMQNTVTEQTILLQLEHCQLTEQHNITKWYNDIISKQSQGLTAQQQQQLQEKISHAQQRVMQKTAQALTLNYPAQLPVSERVDEISQAINQNQVVIIAGETGSGKTTQIPKICLQLGRGIRGWIGHTQPRRLAARAVATRLAEELATPFGSTVGYKVRFTDQVNESTRVKLMTDGILLSEMQQDRLLYQYDTIIIDEAHERSLNIDFILGYLKNILPKRPDLKIIITSATIDVDRFSTHFNQAPIIEVSGRTYPVEVRYRPLIDNENSEQLQGIFDAVDELYREKVGDILIFMTGEKEIRDTADALTRRQLPHTEILPLYARLSNAEQNRIFKPAVGRRIVLATNVAETSLTVPGIKYVIDPGLVRISRYSARTKVQRLPIETISQASANQRKGRCGRTSDGICIRLYAEEDFNLRPEFTDPEILRTNLASVILKMMDLKLGKIEQFPFIDMPDNRQIQDGLILLQELAAINQNTQRYHLTQLGRQLAQLPIDPRLGRMILEAKQRGCLHELLIITAALSIQDPRERPLDKQQAADEKHQLFKDKTSDFVTFLRLWEQITLQQKDLSSSQFRKWCQQHYLNYLRIREWQDIYTQLRQSVKILRFPINTLPADYQSLHCAILSGLLSQIGMKDTERSEYSGTRNSRFMLFPNSGLAKQPPKWCMVTELVETTRLWGRVAANIDPAWIEPLALHLIKRSYSEPHWSRSRGAVMAKEKVMLLGLPIVIGRHINYGNIDPVLSRELFIRHALVDGDWKTNHQFFTQNRQQLLDVEELEHKSRRRDIVVDEQVLCDFYDKRLPESIISAKHFDSWWKQAQKKQPDLLNFEKSMLIRDNASSVSALDYPDHWQQGSFKLPLSYQFEPGEASDGVTVHIPLALLNQIDEQDFDWQVAGLREELIIALIKSLPKPIRRALVPAPNYAQAFLSRVKPFEKTLLESLEREFRLMTGITIDRETWRLEQVPEHLKITFYIEDESGHKLAENKSLHILKQQLQEQLKEQFTVIADESIEQQAITEWQFGDLPQCYEQKHGHYTVKAYPTLIDDTQSVSIQLVETEWQQQQLMQAGIRRLLLLTLPSPIKYLHEKLPNKAKLALYFTPFGTVKMLIDDCINCAIDYLVIKHGGIVWQQDAFLMLKEQIRHELNDAVFTVATHIEKILRLCAEIQKKLKGRIDMSLAFALSDIKSQLEQLIYRGFITDAGFEKLPDIERYLQAILKRMDKLAVDSHKDRASQQKIIQVKEAYQKLLNKFSPHQNIPHEVTEIHWMIEELRVSLFAQQLGTRYPISEKRIMQTIEQAVV